MAENIKPALPVSTEVNRKLALSIEDNFKLSKLQIQESNTLDVIGEKISFLNENHMSQYLTEESLNMRSDKDGNKRVQSENNYKILVQSKEHDKLHMQTEGKEYKQRTQTELNDAALKNIEVLQTEKTLKLDSVSLDNHNLLVGLEEYCDLPMHARKNHQQALEDRDIFNSGVSNERSGDKLNKVEKIHVQVRETQTLISPNNENAKWYTQLKSKRSMKTNKHDEMNLILHRASVGSPEWYTEAKKRRELNVHTKENHEEYMQTTETERLPSKKSNHRRNIQTEYQKMHIPSEEYFKWPTWIEQSATVSFDKGLHIPMDILKLKEKGISEPVEDTRIITTLMHSQMRVEPKIVYGTVAQAKDFPFLVSLKRSLQKISKTKKLWKNYCGGSIINSVKVLTAAHCFEMNKYDYFYHPNKLRVVAGSLFNKLYHSGNTSNSNQHQVRQIKLVKMHSDFNFPLNDIALIFVDEPFRFDLPMNINFIVPARYHTDYASQCYAAGFGQTIPKGKEDGSNELMWAEISLMPRRQCNKVWEMDMISFLCSRSVLKGVSGGDSGGPVVCFNSLDPSAKVGSGKLLVGIVSGRNYDKTTLYTRVSAYQKWIDSNGSCIREYRITLILFALIKHFYTLYG